ncbi:MAG: SDR family oxidoreductase [Actinobacteria bacterium]|nr:SDR family oxidoreductase [Actinomycetota bacterium]
MGLWDYEGMRVVVSGGGGAGMGAAAVTELANLGAEIHVLDLKEPPVDVASYQAANLLDAQATADAIANIPAPIHALFNCAGLPGPPFSDLDTMTVNFIAMRHLAELCADRMTEGGAIASISSTAGAGWLMNMDKWRPLLETNGFAEARAWCEANPEAIASGYAPSKEAIIMWTQWAGIEYAKRNVRLNCISPGPTDTPMMTDFENESGADLVNLFAQGAGRRSRPEEQAYPLIFLNSRAASYVSGENFNTDGGTLGALTTGSLVIDFSELLMGEPGVG